MTRESQRLFFALWPTDAVRTALERACRPVLETCSGRKVPARNYHVTLAFLGDQPASQAQRLAAMSRVLAPEFELILDRFGYWPGPRVTWIGPHRCPAGLTMLVKQIRAELDAFGIDYDGNEYQAHLTLARGAKAPSEPKAPMPVHWPVRSFALVESVPSTGGSTYRVVQSYPAGSISGGSRHDPKQG